MQPCNRCHNRGKLCTFPGDKDVPTECESQCVTSEPPNESIHTVSETSTSAVPFGIANLEVVPAGRFDMGSSYQPDFWDPNILASTNWLDSNNLDDFVLENYDLSWATPKGTAILPTVNTDQASASAHPHPNTFHHGSTNQHMRSGEFYVDGHDSRQPVTKRHKSNASLSAVDQDFSAPFSLEGLLISSHANAAGIQIAQDTYAILVELYERLCCNANPIWTEFHPSDFPSKACLESLICLCFEHCDGTLPFFTRHAFSQNTVHFTLALALASIGAHYVECDHKHKFAISLHEFQRRLMRLTENEGCIYADAKPLQKDVAILLYMVGSAYCGRPHLSRDAINTQPALQDVFTRNSRKVQTAPHADNAWVKDDETWRTWAERECQTRLAYFAWQLDCTWAYHHAARPLLCLSEIKIPLPCHERLWNASSWELWLTAALEQPNMLTQSPSLPRAMQEIYIDKHLPRERSEFARALMIHALFHRSWDVERYFADPLSQWQPVAAKQQSSGILKDPVWLPANPVFARWQNSTCDVLDILHLQANAATARANGHEHPAILHLHLARIVLLAPCKEIVSLARLLVDSDKHHIARNNMLIAAQTDAIRQWAIRHQFKARLSVVHAGALFWHVRRYATDAFYEAPAVALAALTLWAFGAFASSASVRRGIRNLETIPMETGTPMERDAFDDENDELEDMCDVILLDRPIDDELIQTFIKSGGSMEARLGGVGNLYDAEGPETVLIQGCKILMQCENTWGAARERRTLVERLSAHWKTQRLEKAAMLHT